MKKLVSKILLGAMVLSLVACGGGTEVSGISTKKRVESTLKGDYVIYTKDDGNTYFTNNDDIPETLLSTNGRIENIYVDEKRKAIVYEIARNGIYIKSLKNIDKEPEKIYDSSNFFDFYIVYNNNYILIFDSASLLIYDIENKILEHVSDDVYELKAACNSNGDMLFAVDGYGNKEKSFLVKYNLVNKTKDMINISIRPEGINGFNQFKISNCSLEKSICYFIDVNGNKCQLLKHEFGKGTICVDEQEITENQYHMELFEGGRPSSLPLYIEKVFADGTMIYQRSNMEISDSDDKIDPKKMVRYYYDGEKKEKVKYKIASVAFDRYVGYEAFKGNIIINNKKMDLPINIVSTNGEYYISNDGSQVIFEVTILKNKKEIIPSVIYKYNVDSHNTEEIEKDGRLRFYNVIVLNKNTFLYSNVDNDLILNNKIIDHNYKGDIIYDDNLDVMAYRCNEGLKYYKKGKIKLIADGENNNIIGLSNNSNLIWTEDNICYVFKNEKKVKVSENILSVENYKTIKQ